VVVAAVRQPLATGAGIVAALVTAGLIGAIALSGRWPVDAPRAHLDAGGILSIPAERVARIEIAADGDRTVLRREPGGWVVDGAAARPAVARHVDTALRLLAVSAPRRVLAAADYSAERLAEYGLDPPRFEVAAAERRDNSVRIGFGAATPAQNAQYVRVADRPELYLLPRDVGGEWRLARDMAIRPSGLLLPVSMAQIWAVEIVRGGVLHRFERDSEGLWFHHTGQHVHLPGGFVHKADPRQALLLAAELDALDRLPIAASVAPHPDPAALDAAGLAHPATIMLLYSRDSAGPVARIEFGNRSPGGADRYARLGQGGGLLTVPAEVERPLAVLVDLAGTS
jgi:hypothetical protein